MVLEGGCKNGNSNWCNDCTWVKLLSLLLHECKGYKESTKEKYSRLTFKKGGLMVDGLFG